MMNEGCALLGGIQVVTTEGRGFTPEELTERALDKLIYIGNESHPAIREQALAFRQRMKAVILFYLNEAVTQDRLTLANKLREAGYPDLVELLEK
jgi:hypothetical protein